MGTLEKVEIDKGGGGDPRKIYRTGREIKTR